MKQKFVPYDKLSKRARREIDKKRRNVWDISPATRIAPDKHKEKKRQSKI